VGSVGAILGPFSRSSDPVGPSIPNPPRVDLQLVSSSDRMECSAPVRKLAGYRREACRSAYESEEPVMTMGRVHPRADAPPPRTPARRSAGTAVGAAAAAQASGPRRAEARSPQGDDP